MDDLGEEADYIRFLTSGKEAKKAVDYLLRLEQPLCLPVVFKRAGVNESKVSLVGIYMHGKFYIFDLRHAADAFIASGLFRLFEIHTILKVIHDASDDLQQMIQHRVAINSIFDTHKAFDRVALWNGMPTRKITITALHRKLSAITSELNIEEAELDAAIQSPVFVDRTGMDWGQRPVNTAMLVQLAAEVAALRQCYFGLCSIGRHYDSLMTLRRAERIGEARATAVMAIGSLAAAQSGEKTESEQRESNSLKLALCAGIQNNLLSMGQSVLDETRTMAAYRLIPYCFKNN